MAQEVKFYVGASKDKHDNDIDTKSYYSMEYAAEELLTNHFGGFTKVNSTGGWRNPKTEKVVVEFSVIYTVVYGNDNTNILTTSVEIVANGLKRIFNQSSVLVTETNLHSMRFV